MVYRRHNARKPLWPKLVVIVIVLGIAFFGYQWQRYNYLINTPVNPGNTEETIITIKKGDNSKKIAESLLAKNLILDADAFKMYGKFNNLDKDIKVGRFAVTPSQNIAEIYSVIISNKTRQAVITIPEGSTIKDIDQILVDQSLIQSGEFIAATKAFKSYEKYPFLNQEEQQKLPHPLEGYLFPDTYFIDVTDYDNQALISLLLNTYKQKAFAIAQSSSKPLNQTMIVASMIEKEANRDQDRPKIAGIIWKRYEENWALGIDATLLYLKDDREIDFKDLQENSPYNTRKNAGLPPGPIANPGLASIKAAASPENTPYYFYLTSKDGEMIYAISNEEHNQNKAKYL